MYKFHHDPGHGWLAVKLAELEALNIADKITTCSYHNGATVYLEEDLDAGTFINAKTEALGISDIEAKRDWFKANIREANNDNHAIRGYKSYAPEARAV